MNITSSSLNWRSFVRLLVLTLAFIMPAQNSFAEPGVINRAPAPKAVVKTNLDKLAESLGDVAKSMDQIVTRPDEIETEVPLITNPAEDIEAPSQVIAKPEPIKARPQETKPPATRPLLASPARLNPVPETANKKSRTRTIEKEIVATEEKLNTNVKTSKNKVSKPTYIKLGFQGNELKEDAAEWNCVIDTRNGLVWEVKESDGGLRDKKHSYSWFDPSHENLKGIADGGRCKGGIQCDTNAYIQALNAQNFCGHSDWRLPTREEIQQLVEINNDRTEATINRNLFPDTVPSWYWTSSSNRNNPDYAWYVLFRNGIPLSDLKERPKHIRLVRTDKKA